METGLRKTWKSKHSNLVGERNRSARLAAVPPISLEDMSGRLAAQGITLDRWAISRIEKRTRYVTDYELIAFAKALKLDVRVLLLTKPA